MIHSTHKERTPRPAFVNKRHAYVAIRRYSQAGLLKTTPVFQSTTHFRLEPS